MHRLRISLALCACAALALPVAASARPVTRGFSATFPVASALCTRAATGHLPLHLRSSAAAVELACTTLKTSFTNAQNAYTTAVAPLRQQAVNALTTLRATCKADRAAHNLAACKAARTQTRTLVASLRTQVRAAAATYHATVDAARKAFWATIHGLKGGATLPADHSVSQLTPLTLPSNSAIAKA